MPEPEDPTSGGLHLPASDPAAPAVEALRAMAARGPVEASPELAAFLEDPAGQGLGTTPHPRSDRVTVVRLPIRRAGRVAVAVGAALALAALGGVAVAATGGDDHEPAVVQQDDPSDTTTTTEASETETATETTTATSEDTEGDDQDDDAQGEDAQDDSDATSTATHTPNATAYANHHDGKGSDDEHADVNGGGSVDHHGDHPKATHETKGDDDSDEADDEGSDHQGDGAGDDQGDDEGEHAPASNHGGDSHDD
jgi:hypothetical protein